MTSKAAIRRRDFLTCGGLAGAAWLYGLRGAAAQDQNPEKTAAEFMTREAQRAVDRGLQWLANAQHEDGAFGSGGYSRNVAVCGLAGLAMLSSGSTPGRGPYGAHVGRCLGYILEQCQDSGFIQESGSSTHGPMYGHGFATLFLAEVYGMTQRGDLREKLSKAVELIVNTQNEEGGWRYQPQRRDADISVTISQIMALRAARNAGFFVPNETVDRCVEYVKRSQNADGGFMYMLQGGPSEFPRSAAGVVALYSAGIYEGTEIEKGLEYLMKFLPKGQDDSRTSHFYYGQYYGVQAMWHAGGQYWNRWYPAARDLLLQMQRDDGSWMDSICAEYGTSMALLVLLTPNNYLPIFQR